MDVPIPDAAWDGVERRGPDRPWAPDEPRDTQVETGRDSRIGARRALAHAAAGVGSWIVFLLVWWWAATRHLPADWLATVAVATCVLAVFAVLTPMWVAWNRRIYRRRHRRTQPIHRQVAADRDHLGRPVVLPQDLRAGGHDVVLHVVVGEDGEEIKRYEPHDADNEQMALVA